MINWLKKLFSKKERALYYDVVISNDDAKELEYYLNHCIIIHLQK